MNLGTPTPEGGQSPDLFSGMRIPFLKQGDFDTLLIAKRGNQIIAALNALLNAKVKIGVVQANAAGQYIAAGRLILSKQDATIELLLAPAAGGGASGGSGGGNVAAYTLVTVNADDLTCTDASGNTVTVKKHPNLRNSVTSSTYGGTVTTYSYGVDYVTRTATAVTGGTTTVYNEHITPPYGIPSSLIIAAKIGTDLYDLNVDGRCWSMDSTV